MSKVAAIAVRGFLIVFGAVVLALSVTLAKQQAVGSPPPETSFFSFAGAFGLIVSIIAILAIFIEHIPQVGVAAADALASLFYLAGAIALTVALKPVSSCTSSSDRARSERFVNKLLNGGCTHEKNGDIYCPNSGSKNDAKHFDSYTAGRCQQVQADFVFGYVAFVFGVASAILTLLAHRRAGRNMANYV
ncbi:marvel domain-containing protein [Xylaria cf. heliscus]|nr:marvel domain-containing protein [Xylaria cf. heliscus]